MKRIPEQSRTDTAADTRTNMDRRRFLGYLGGGAAALSVGGCADSDPTPSSRPNIVIVVADQYRTDVCGIYGGSVISTPNIDRIGQEGMTFNRGLSTCPLCTPYRGMLLTGRYPTHSGLVLNWVHASAAQNPNCLANVFSAAGYDSGFIGKWHLSAGIHENTHQIKPDSELHWAMQQYQKHAGHLPPERRQERQRLYQSIMKYQAMHPNSEFVPPGSARLGFDHWAAYNFHTAFKNYWYYRDRPEKIKTDGYETDVQFDLAIDYLKERRNSAQPFLLVVAPHPPHPPLTPEATPRGYLDSIPETLPWSPNVPTDHPRRRNPQEIRCYYAMAKNVDDNVGRLLTYMDESGLSDNTIVIFTSDHGEMHGGHGLTNKMVPFTEAVSIPLLMRWPGRIPAASRSDVLQTPLDHLTTLCALAGLTPPGETDGIDLSPVVLGTGSVERDAALMMNYVSHWDFFQSGTIWPEWRGLHTGQYTYARWLSGKEELYDNLEDPFQMHDLAPEDPPVRKGLAARLDQLLAESHDQFLPGNAYSGWYDERRNLLQTALGPVPKN